MTDVPQYAQWGFTDGQWGLLVGMPQAVLTAASAATPDSARKTRAENEAGLEKISEARASASTLVSTVAQAALDAAGDPELGEDPPVIQPADPEGYVADVLDRAGQVRLVLSGRDDADSETYRHWLVEIADTVVGAASTGGVLGIGGETVTESERTFRDNLAKALLD